MSGFTNKKISVKNIIAKVYQDLQIGSEVSTGAIIEWSAEVLNKINVYSQLDPRYACIKVENYKAEIPCDLVYLNYIGKDGIQLTKSSGGDIFNFIDTSDPKPYAYNERKMTNIPFVNGMNHRNKLGEQFIFENGWIKTSFKEGSLYIQYQAMPMDEDGFPLIPDHESFRDAIFWYIAHKIFYIRSISEDRFWRFYKDADEKWRYYVNQSGAEAMMPDLSTLENLKRNYISMIPKINSYSQFFSNLNNSPRI